jgi:D-alanine transaminase/branched-chain amino acid aminotransferase
MGFKYFSHNGRLLPASQAQIPLALVEYSYGFGVYENVRYAGGIVYFLQDHAERLLESARVIELEHSFTLEFVKSSILELVASTESEACNIKVLLIGGQTAEAAQLFVLCLNPLFPDRKIYREGVAVTTSEYERAFPQAKTLNMLGSYLCYRKAKRAGAYDSLLINRAGNITEGTRTNFFCIAGKTIYSPDEKDILLGVTRKAMLKAAAGDGFELAVGDIGAEELGNYEGTFITSTSSKIVPIKSVDGRVLSEAPPESLVRLMKIFGDFLAEGKGVLD